jgi:hypothetical protein
VGGTRRLEDLMPSLLRYAAGLRATGGDLSLRPGVELLSKTYV